MNRSKTSRKKSPSRERYEKENPTVSARLPKETRDKLLVVLPKLGMSLAEAFKILTGELEVKAVPIDEARRRGYEEARNRYMITYPCSVCGKMIQLTGPEAKEAARRCMIDHGWGHAECHKRRRQLGIHSGS